MKKALFLDRDGVINIDYGYVHKIEDFILTNFIIDFCKQYLYDYLIIVISNQSGIGRGFYDLNDLFILDKYMKELLLRYDIPITASYYCPHHPNEGCMCRKPNIGLIMQAKEDFDIDLANSILVGDKMSDLDCGYNAGIGNLIFKKGRYKLEKRSYHFICI